MLENDEFLAVELLEVLAGVFTLEGLLKDITYKFFEGPGCSLGRLLSDWTRQSGQ